MTAVGTAAQAAAARKSQKAMSGAREAERIRQKGYQEQSDAAFNESMSQQGSDLQKEKIAQAEAQRTETTQGAQQQAPVVSVPTQGGAPAVVADETSARVGAGNTQAAQDAANRAAMASFGDVQLGNALLNSRYGQQQAQIGNFMRGSSNVLGAEIEDASHAGDSLKGIGSGLIAGGSLLGMGAGMGLGATAATAAPAAASTMGRITASSVLPTTGSVTNYGVDPSMFALKNPNNWIYNRGVQAPYRF